MQEVENINYWATISCYSRLFIQPFYLMIACVPEGRHIAVKLLKDLISKLINKNID